MKRILCFAAILTACAVMPGQARTDPKIGSIRKAFLVAIDDNKDAAMVVACMAEKIQSITPIAAVTTKDEADAILKVRSKIPGAGARYALGMMGGTPSGNIDVYLPDGKKIWSHGAKNRAMTGGLVGAARKEESIACGIADRLLHSLLDEMQKSPDWKK